MQYLIFLPIIILSAIFIFFHWCKWHNFFQDTQCSKLCKETETSEFQRINELKKAMDELCLLVDEFSNCDLTPNTPLYNFQQSMIANVKRFRGKKA